MEHLTSLRAIPDLNVIRPADAWETAEAWRAAVRRRGGPTALCLTRQGLPVLDRAGDSGLADASGLHRGGYVLAEAERGSAQVEPDIILIASGSEVHPALEARDLLAHQDVAARVVSMPCFELFEEQEESYRLEVLPPGVRARLSVEAGVSFGWERYVGDEGEMVAIDRFGASAPGARNMKEFGFTGENIAARAIALLRRFREAETAR